MLYFNFPGLSAMPRGNLPIPGEVAYAMRIASEAGFDGIELIRWPHTDTSKVERLAYDYGLGLNWHEVWNPAGDPTHFFSWAFAGLLLIPLTKKPLPADVLKDRRPFVAYPHHHGEIGARTKRYVWLQTARLKGDPLDWKEFVRIVRGEGFRVVFDTQHALEFYHDVWGVERFQGADPVRLQNILAELFLELRENVAEIHLNNFDPELGHEHGRNLFPREGVLDLHAFAGIVRNAGWKDGFITPEVAPWHLKAAGNGSVLEGATRLCAWTRSLFTTPTTI